MVVVAVCRCLGLSGDLGAGEDVQLHLYRCSGLTLRSRADTAVGEWMSGTAESGGLAIPAVAWRLHAVLACLF